MSISLGTSSPTTTIRFSIDDDVDNGDEFYIDNVKIDYSTSPTYVEGGSAVSIAPDGALIKDTDDTTLQSATVTLTNAQAGDLLSIIGQLPAGIVASSYNAQTGVLTLSGEATLANYQAALAQIQFSNSGDNPGSADRTITVVVSDGMANSNTGTVTVHVTPVNDAPEFNATALTTGAQGNSYTLAGLAVTDSDAGANPLTLWLGSSTGAVEFGNFGPDLTVTNNGSHVVGASGTLDAINAALASGVSYTPESTQPRVEIVTATIEDHHGGTDTLNFVFGVGYSLNDAVALAGSSGDDIIFSAGTDATLTGNGGQDTFVFTADNGGTAHITDFNVFDDFLQISHNIFATADAVLGSAHGDGNGNTVISSSNYGSVVLEDVDWATFQSIDHSHIVIV